jgi:exoribonuclease R
MRADADAAKLLHDGFAALRTQYGIDSGFDAAVLAAADKAAARPVVPGPDRRDARDIEFVTLDPATSIDLDQAFALARDGHDLVLYYAIADVGFFVERGSLLEKEAWKRGNTFYFPGERIPQYPPVLCEGAASLLPNVDRPAVLLTVVVSPNGTTQLRSAERVVIRSRAKLAYENITPGQLPLLDEFSARIEKAEDARGATRIEFPDQAVVADAAAPGGLKLVADSRLASEDQNAAMSLAANLAVAKAMFVAKVGLFRVMDDPDEREMGILHRVAHALGVPWPKGKTLRDVNRTLDGSNPKHLAFLRMARRLGGGASYAVYDPAVVPLHSAIAATYAHATAPLRRLADRYVLDLAVEISVGQRPSTEEQASLVALPEVMRKAASAAAQIEHGVIDLVETVTLLGRVGETFAAQIIDNDRRSLLVQLDDPPVRASIRGEFRQQTGDNVFVKLTAADIATRKVTFEVVRR